MVNLVSTKITSMHENYSASGSKGKEAINVILIKECYSELGSIGSNFMLTVIVRLCKCEHYKLSEAFSTYATGKALVVSGSVELSHSLLGTSRLHLSQCRLSAYCSSAREIPHRHSIETSHHTCRWCLDQDRPY